MRCLFYCTCVSEHPSAYNYELHPVYGDEVNKVYWEATPSGALTLTGTKGKGIWFQVGREYYVDITEKPNEIPTPSQ